MPSIPGLPALRGKLLLPQHGLLVVRELAVGMPEHYRWSGSAGRPVLDHHESPVGQRVHSVHRIER